MERFVYADNAATTSVSKTALDAMMPYLTELYGNPSSLYRIGQQAKEVLEQAREEMVRKKSKRIYAEAQRQLARATSRLKVSKIKR